MQMLEAFRALNALNEDTFSLNSDGIEKLSNFTQNDDLEDDVQIIDPEAETEEELQDNYIGKVILDCCVCHSKLYKDPAEVELDETGELANVGEECPYCFTPDGFKVIGEVVPFASKDEEDESEEPADDSEEVVNTEEEELNDENLEEGLIGDINVPINLDASGSSVGFLGGTASTANEDLEENISNGNAEGGFLDTAKRPGGSTNGSGTNHKALDGKKTKTVKAKDLKPGMVTDTGKILKVTNVGWVNGEPSIEVNYGGIGNRGSNASDTVSADREYQVLDESLSEAIEDLSMTANDTHIEVSEEENGKVTVSMEPAGNDEGGEMVAPVSTEMEAEIMSDEPALDADLEDSDVEAPEEDTSIDADFDEFDEETMDGLGESYFKKVYENVESFKTTAVKTSGNSMIIEGLLKFDSGNEKSTSFVFESLDATKHGKFRFVGDNKELTEGKKAFMLTGTIKENKLMLESLNYNYKHIDEEGNTSRVYGTERIAKGE